MPTADFRDRNAQHICKHGPGIKPALGRLGVEQTYLEKKLRFAEDSELPRINRCFSISREPSFFLRGVLSSDNDEVDFVSQILEDECAEALEDSRGFALRNASQAPGNKDAEAGEAGWRRVGRRAACVEHRVTHAEIGMLMVSQIFAAMGRVAARKRSCIRRGNALYFRYE